MDKKEKLKNSKLYLAMQDITRYLDRYYLDGVAGLVPGGVGDAVSGVFCLVHIYISLFKLHSIPLTLAILCNTLRDIFLGMLPFFVGDVIDFFHKANSKNMALIEGFVNQDRKSPLFTSCHCCPYDRNHPYGKCTDMDCQDYWNVSVLLVCVFRFQLRNLYFLSDKYHPHAGVNSFEVHFHVRTKIVSAD